MLDQPRARRGDPATSHAAAASVRKITISKVKKLILAILKAGPLTDEDIALEVKAHLAFKRQNWYSPSGLRTRRRELVDAGLVEDSGERGKTEAGRETIKWRLRLAPIPVEEIKQKLRLAEAEPTLFQEDTDAAI